MSTCPCCSNRLLRHVRQGSVYWFCRTCWAEMPDLAMYDRTFAASVVEPTSITRAHFAKILQRDSKAHLRVS